ncbi:MAG: DNA polymerase domain-containing protein [Thermoplasmataceae archaeon]|jgi:DNA polymerase I
MKVSFRLMAASYRREDVAVELFGRTREGKSVTALYKNFRPYFDLIDPPDSYIDELRKSDEFVKEEDKTLWVDGADRRIKRIYIKSPWKVPEFRSSSPVDVLAADIPFHHRFIYDLDLGACVEVDGFEDPEEKKRFTTDIVLTAYSAKSTEDYSVSAKIFSFDIENIIETKQILVIGWSMVHGEERSTGSFTGNERDILTQFKNFVNHEDPDIIIGYNIDGYDLPLLIERMKVNNVRADFARDFSFPHRVQDRYWRMHGRIISDVWWNVKKYLHPKSETLNAVSRELLNEGKDNINRLKIKEEWENRQDEVIKYCIKDADLTLRIYEKLRVVDRNMFMSTVTKLPLDDVTNGGTSNYVDSILIREADRKNIGVKLTYRVDKTAPIEGGYVRSIGAGLYSNVVVLDFKSMYPSMIIKYNICFTTLSPDGKITAPNGVHYLDRTQKEGLIPKILQDLMRERDEVKKMAKNASSESDRNYYDGVQGAIKILMNTFYGVLASSFYRFTNPEIGSSVTHYARNTIQNVMDKLERSGHRVIYGDTDSVFIESGKSSVDETVKFGEELSKRLSAEEGILLDFEKVLDPFFSHGAKKRYVGRIAYPKDQEGKILIRGYEVRRTDSFDLQSESQSKVFEFIMNRDPEGAVEYAKDIISKISRGDRAIPIQKLVISRSVRDESEYANSDSLANVRIARKLKEMGETFVSGMKVSWIVTNSKKSPQEVEPYIEGQPFEYTPDWLYYSKRVSETLNRILEGFSLNVLSDARGEAKVKDTDQSKKIRSLDSF